MKQRGRPRPVLIFFKKTLYKVKASGLRLQYNISMALNL